MHFSGKTTRTGLELKHLAQRKAGAGIGKNPAERSHQIAVSFLFLSRHATRWKGSQKTFNRLRKNLHVEGEEKERKRTPQGKVQRSNCSNYTPSILLLALYRMGLILSRITFPSLICIKTPKKEE